MFRGIRFALFNFAGGYAMSATLSHAIRGPPGKPRIVDPNVAPKTSSSGGFFGIFGSKKNDDLMFRDQTSLMADCSRFAATYDILVTVCFAVMVMSIGTSASVGALAAYGLEDPFDGARRYQSIKDWAEQQGIIAA